MNEPSSTLAPSERATAVDAARDVQVARQQVEQVFGLTGGELSDAAWLVLDEAGTERAYAYWYEGPPEWAAHDFADRYDADYRTVIGCCLFGAPPATIEDDAGTWTRVAGFVNSGEAECPWSQADDCDARAQRPCELCATAEGEAHGHIYLGDGWCEVVYKRQASEEEEGAGKRPGRAVAVGTASPARRRAGRGELREIAGVRNGEVLAVSARHDAK
jgi:hypothetical protein